MVIIGAVSTSSSVRSSLLWQGHIVTRFPSPCCLFCYAASAADKNSLSLSLSLSHPTCEVPFPPRRPGQYRKGMIPDRPRYQGVRGSVWDPEPSKERVGDWGGPATVWSLLCVPEKGVQVSPTRGVVLTDLQSSI
jgi:hypothetical protein